MAAAVAREHGPGVRDRGHERRRAALVDAARRNRITCRTGCATHLRHCRRRRCARPGCRVPAPTAATTPAMRPSTRRCCRSSPAARCACSTCGTTAPAGTRKARRCVYRGRAGLDASGNVVAYDFHGKGFSRQDVVQRRERSRRTRWPGSSPDWKPQSQPCIFQTPGGALRVREQALLVGNDPAAARPRLAAAHRPFARSARARDAFRERIVHRRSRARGRRRSRRIPARVPEGRAPRRGRQGRGGKGAVAERGPNPNRGKGDVMTGPRLLLHRAQRHRGRDGRRSRSGPPHAAACGRRSSPWRTTAARSSIRAA